MYLMRILLLLILVSPCLQGQTVFNRTYRIGGNNFTELLVTDTGYVSAALDDDNVKRLDFSVYDLQGNPLDTVQHDFNNVGYLPENCGKCLHEVNHSLYYAQSHFDAGDSAYVHFLKLDANLNLLDSGNYVYRDSLGTQIYAMAFDSDSTFLITGYTFRKKPPLLGKYDLLVAKFDTAFNLLWEKGIEDNRPNEDLGYIGLDITVDHYNSVLISGYGKYGPNSSIVARFRRSDGYMHWFREYVGPLGDAGMYTSDNGDGTYQFVRHVNTAQTSTKGTLYNKIVTGTIDSTGSYSQLSTLGPNDQMIFTTDLIPTSDGNFYAAGFTNINGARNSFGLKFAPNGDSLWMRYYYHEDQPDHSQVEIFFETPDSGFIHAGYYVDLFQSAGTGVFTWLLKTDQYGCDSIGCHKVGLYEAHIPGLLEVFPNPSTGDFRLSWTYGPPETFALTIQDVSGKVIYRDDTAFLSEQDYNVDLRQHPPGVYLLHLTLDGKHVVSRKLVVF
ncbi:MAG TPA: hypothetical protein DCG19_00345 [Cryomorphaceae bacterium]|nr:hypothetical protein [Owenweeksia sp.]HAD95817.1 hypothetical protein [Cryomorphaceae bacterium]HBF22155.1 hypothetical protein [Cryomorphaceae bacterium]